MGYIAPINVDFVTEMIDRIQQEQETAIIGRVKMVVDVDEKELLKALQYDRNQYTRGHKDGAIYAISKIREKLKEAGFECPYLDELESRF